MSTVMRHALLGLLMCLTAGLALAMKPARDVSVAHNIDLEKIVPGQFADWKIDPRILPVEPPPDLRESHRRDI